MSERRFSVEVRSGSRGIVRVQEYPVYQKEITFLFGESGIGKSIISKALYGLLDNEELDVTIDSQPYSKHLNDVWTRQVRKNSFFVFQEPSSHLNPLLTIQDQLREGNLDSGDDREILNYLWQTESDSAIRKIIDVYPKPYRPSGGEKQRILLAMAFKRINTLLEQRLFDEPTYFVFDEPTGSLDNNYRNLFLQLLFAKYAASPFTILIITHDYSIISEIYKNHRNILPCIHFKELSRIQEPDVEVHDFSADQYLNWLESPRSSRTSVIAEEPVLQFDPEFRIFGRNLGIFEDPSHTSMSTLTIRKGDMVYLKAPSGVGKTTLAKIVMGIYHPEKFRMMLGGINITEETSRSVWPKRIWGRRAGMVFQHADEALNLESTVFETFRGLPLKESFTSESLKKKLLELFDGPLQTQFLKKKVAYLSGGQKQRLNLLRTLVLAPQLIILDEPLNGLDFNSVKKVLALLNQKRAAGSAFLMISHNEEIFDHFIDERNIYYLAEL